MGQLVEALLQERNAVHAQRWDDGVKLPSKVIAPVVPVDLDVSPEAVAARMARVYRVAENFTNFISDRVLLRALPTHRAQLKANPVSAHFYEPLVLGEITAAEEPLHLAAQPYVVRTSEPRRLQAADELESVGANLPADLTTLGINLVETDAQGTVIVQSPGRTSIEQFSLPLPVDLLDGAAIGHFEQFADMYSEMAGMAAPRVGLGDK